MTDSDPRVRLVAPGRPGHAGDVVVYWTQTTRRAADNAALHYAVNEANRRKLPLLVYEALRVDYPFASDRIHRFVLEGAKVEAPRYRALGADYAFFLPRSADEARPVLRALAARAALIVTDDFPSFVIPKHIAALAKNSPAPVVAFEDTGIVPLALFPKEEYAARTIRPKVHNLLAAWQTPIVVPRVRTQKPLDLPFDRFDVEKASLDAVLAKLPIDHTVKPASATPGGSAEAARRLTRLVEERLSRYPEHNHPDVAATSNLSPYLHFGMVGARTVLAAVRAARAPQEAKDAFIEQLVVRRTLSYNFAWHNPRHATLDALPIWARETLRKHEADPRSHLYDRATLEAAKTGDALWNAGQRELVETGVMHNYIRMLWGKCVLLWKKTSEEALSDLVYLNDKYALDGRDPNTYTGILWCFGKHDRPWPERAIYGTVRSMTTASAEKKLQLKAYLARWGSSTRPLF